MKMPLNQRLSWWRGKVLRHIHYKDELPVTSPDGETLSGALYAAMTVLTSVNELMAVKDGFEKDG